MDRIKKNNDKIEIKWWKYKEKKVELKKKLYCSYLYSEVSQIFPVYLINRIREAFYIPKKNYFNIFYVSKKNNSRNTCLFIFYFFIKHVYVFGPWITGQFTQTLRHISSLNKKFIEII